MLSVPSGSVEELERQLKHVQTERESTRKQYGGMYQMYTQRLRRCSGDEADKIHSLQADLNDSVQDKITEQTKQEARLKGLIESTRGLSSQSNSNRQMEDVFDPFAELMSDKNSNTLVRNLDALSPSGTHGSEYNPYSLPAGIPMSPIPSSDSMLVDMMDDALANSVPKSQEPSFPNYIHGIDEDMSAATETSGTPKVVTDAGGHTQFTDGFTFEDVTSTLPLESTPQNGNADPVEIDHFASLVELPSQADTSLHIESLGMLADVKDDTLDQQVEDQLAETTKKMQSFTFEKKTITISDAYISAVVSQPYLYVFFKQYLSRTLQSLPLLTYTPQAGTNVFEYITANGESRTDQVANVAIPSVLHGLCEDARTSAKEFKKLLATKPSSNYLMQRLATVATLTRDTIKPRVVALQEMQQKVFSIDDCKQRLSLAVAMNAEILTHQVDKLQLNLILDMMGALVTLLHSALYFGATKNEATAPIAVVWEAILAWTFLETMHLPLCGTPACYCAQCIHAVLFQNVFSQITPLYTTVSKHYYVDIYQYAHVFQQKSVSLTPSHIPIVQTNDRQETFLANIQQRGK